MTRRAWLLIGFGVVVIATSGGIALAQRSSAATVTPSASWNMYPPAQWRRIERRSGLANLRIAGAITKRNGTPVAVLAGHKGVARCFVTVVGQRVGVPTCNLRAPLVDVMVPDGRWTEVVGVARKDVAGVAAEAVVDGKPWVQGIALLAMPNGFAFASGMSTRHLTLLARDRQGRLLARVHVR